MLLVLKAVSRVTRAPAPAAKPKPAAGVPAEEFFSPPAAKKAPAKPRAKAKPAPKPKVAGHDGGIPKRPSRHADPTSLPLPTPAELAEARRRGVHPPVPPTAYGLKMHPDPESDLQATFYDAKGRIQHRYHPRHREQAVANKFGAVHTFAQQLPRIRRRVKNDLGLEGAHHDRVAAAVVRLIDTHQMRIGSERFTEGGHGDEETFGASSLRKNHVKLKGNKVTIHFTGKHGAPWHRESNDPALAKTIRHMHTLPGDRLFQFQHTDGTIKPMDETRVREYLKPHGVLPKHFRTYAGTKMAAEHLIAAGPPADAKTAKKTVSEVVKKVAEHLGNTPAVAKSQYINPEILAAYHEGRLKPNMIKALPHHPLTDDEFLEHLNRLAWDFHGPRVVAAD